ncbi:MAG: DUF4956 domain-containing protein [Pseudomonadales bacterium]
MKRSSQFVGPLFLITTFYLLAAALVWGILQLKPDWQSFLPFGGLKELFAPPSNQLEVIVTATKQPILRNFDAATLAFAIFGTLILMVPVSWVYFITTRRKRIDRSFVQTIIVLPVIVAGIAMIVQHSLPLAFSLAGIVAAVRFRFTLTEPAYALYIFVGIAVGLGAGVSALDISFVISVAFVYVSLVLWKLDYGSNMTSAFFAFLTGRGQDDDELQ